MTLDPHMSPADDHARENAARARLDGYCERTLVARHGQRQREQGAVERWIADNPPLTPERAAELRARGWTPINHDTPSMPAGRVTTTTR